MMGFFYYLAGGMLNLMLGLVIKFRKHSKTKSWISVFQFVTFVVGYLVWHLATTPGHHRLGGFKYFLVQDFKALVKLILGFGAVVLLLVDLVLAAPLGHHSLGCIQTKS